VCHHLIIYFVALSNVLALLPSVVTDAELERLQQALKILSDAEKQLRLSSERSTWFTAALLQLGSGRDSETHSRSSSKQSGKAASETMLDAVRESSASRSASHPLFTIRGSRNDHRTASGHSSPHGLASLSSRMRPSDNLIYGQCRSVDRVLLDSAQTRNSTEQGPIINGSSDSLVQIWRACIENCHSKTLRQLLCDHGKLASIKEYEGRYIQCISRHTHAVPMFSSIKIMSKFWKFLSFFKSVIVAQFEAI
jgi:hypothetical protein